MQLLYCLRMDDSIPLTLVSTTPKTDARCCGEDNQQLSQQTAQVIVVIGSSLSFFLLAISKFVNVVSDAMTKLLITRELIVRELLAIHASRHFSGQG